MTFGAYVAFYSNSIEKDSGLIKSIQMQTLLDSEAVEAYKKSNSTVAISFEQIAPYRKFNSFNTDFISQSYLFEPSETKQFISKCIGLGSGFITQKADLLELYVSEKSYSAYSSSDCNKNFLIPRDWNPKKNSLPDQLSIKIPLGSLDFPSMSNSEFSSSEPHAESPPSENALASEPVSN